MENITLPDIGMIVNRKMIDSLTELICRGNPLLELLYLPPTPEATIKYRKRYHKRGLKMKGR
jgi:hypothetical protein